MRNRPFLITYADSMGGNLKALDAALDSHFQGLFGGIHILPPFVSSGDRGFAPVDYHTIDPAFGDWADMRRLSHGYALMLDVMVNHMSRRSSYFEDYLQKGEESAYADWFLSLSKLWPDGVPRQADINKLFRRRETPYSTYSLADGTTRRLWTTFGAEEPSEQVDLDVNSPDVRRMFLELFDFFAVRGVSLVRLDALPYINKVMGTDCFFVEPDIFDFLEWITPEAEKRGITLLSEIHTDSTTQYRLAERGYWIYDFLLPYVTLHTLMRREASLFCRMLEDRPHNQFTTLDCHDGVPVKPDLDGWVPPSDVRFVTELCAERGARFTRVLSREQPERDGLDVHQICGSYYDMLGRDDDAYLAARALQLFVPGIPLVYYAGLLAGSNDEAAADRTGDDRELNRHNYAVEEIAAACGRPVVQRLVALLRLRNTHPAFDGVFRYACDVVSNTIVLHWEKGAQTCALTVELHAMRSSVDYTDAIGIIQHINLQVGPAEPGR